MKTKRKLHVILTSAILAIAMLAAAVLAACALQGCVNSKERAERTMLKEKLDRIMTYTEEERQLIDAYLEHSAGVKLEIYKNGFSGKATLTINAAGLGELPDAPELAGAEKLNVRATFWASFAEAGNQHLTVKNARNGRAEVAYNELHTEEYTEDTVFSAGVFYKIRMEYAFAVKTGEDGKLAFEGEAPELSADSEYVLSTEYPTFGGKTAEPVKPMVDIHMRDPYILTGPDGYYYMTGTYEPADWHNTKEIHVYRSTDLSDWEDLGAAWVYDTQATWQKDIITDGSSPIWAPELHYIKGNYWICYSLGWGAMAGSILKSTTGRPEGPYEDVCGKPIFDYIDATLYTEGSKVWAIYSDGLIAELKSDMTDLKTAPKPLKSVSGQQVGFEGCYMMKIGGLYYLCSSTYCIHYDADGKAYQAYDSFYAVSDNLEGPYSERRLLLENGGHNNLFYSVDGRLLTTAFYGPGFSERPAIAEIEVLPSGLLKVK